MTDRYIMRSPDSGEQGTWLETRGPDTHLVPFQERGNHRLSFAMIRGILFRQRWLIGIVIVAALIAGVVFTLLATPMYQAQSSVRIEPYGTRIVEGQDLEQGVAANQVYDLLATYVGVINSRSLAEQVAENLNLAERYDFLGEDVDLQRPDGMTDEQWHDAKQDMAASILHASVDSEIPMDNWIIEIVYRSEDPAIAAEMANAYSFAFANFYTQEALSNNEYAQGYITEQIDTVRDRLREAEQAANAYARANGIIVQSVTDEEGGISGTTLTSSNLSNINTRVSEARAARIAAEQRWRAIQNLPAAQLAEVQNNGLLQSLIAERAQRNSELISLRQRLRDGHPQVVAVLGQIESLDEQIDRTSSDIKSVARNDYQVAANQEQALEAELNRATGATLSEQESQVQYGVLEREAAALRDQLEALLNRYNQISTAANVQSGTVNPLDSASIPDAPYSPSLLRNLLAALVLGTGLAGGLALLRETLDDKIRSTESVEERLQLPLLGHTPYVDRYDIASDEEDPFSPLMEAYGSIRSTIEFRLGSDNQVIQLTSSMASEGKSTTAIILAELFAGHGRKTLLIDCDLRRPSISKLLDIGRPKIGLVEVLLGQTDLQSAIVRGKHDNLSILPIASIPSNPTEVLASKHMQQFIDRCRQEYSLVIFDSSPMLGLADAPMLGSMVDGTIFVLEANRVGAAQARNAIHRLETAGGKAMGVILTKYRALEAGESYDYQYAYYQYGDPKGGGD